MCIQIPRKHQIDHLTARLSVFLERIRKKDQKKRTLDEILLDFVKDYRQVFENKVANRFPPSRPWDHAIKFKKDFDYNTKGS